MRILVAFDLPAGTRLPSTAFGSDQGPLQVPQGRVKGTLHHPALLLTTLDQSTEQAVLIVVSKEQAPREIASKWGYGWRCGRNIRDEWIGIALQEGRAVAVLWLTITGTKVEQKWFGDEEALRALIQTPLTSMLSDQKAEIWICRRDTTHTLRFRDVDLPAFDAAISVWHCSSQIGLKELALTRGRLWVSPSQAFASCFGVGTYSNLGFFQGVDRVASTEPTIYLVVPAGAETKLAQPCSLYRAKVSPFEIRMPGVSGYEVALFRTAEVLAELRFDSCREALATAGVEVVELANSLPIDPELEKKCQPYRHAIESFVQLPLAVALRLPCKQWALWFWLAARLHPELLSAQPQLLRAVIERWWLPSIASASRLPELGYHGLEHLMQTSLAAAHIASKEGANPIVAALVGLLHDSGREGDEDGTGHAGLSVALMEKTLGRELRSLLPSHDLQIIRFAIAHHANGTTSTDGSIGSAWDADRLRLAWERGFEPRYFSTETGRHLAALKERAVMIEFGAIYGRDYFPIEPVG